MFVFSPFHPNPMHGTSHNAFYSSLKHSYIQKWGMGVKMTYLNPPKNKQKTLTLLHRVTLIMVVVFLWWERDLASFSSSCNALHLVSCKCLVEYKWCSLDRMLCILYGITIIFMNLWMLCWLDTSLPTLSRQFGLINN